MKRKLAIFDIDGTIFRSSLVIELVNELIKEKVFPESAEKEIERYHTAWLNREGEYEDYVMKVVEMYKKHLKGVREVTLRQITRNVIAREKKKVYRFTRNLIKELITKKYFLLAISASPGTIVREFTRQLNFDHYFGTQYEIKDGVFTGSELRNVFLNKKVLLHDFFHKHKEEIDFTDSIGVGDTESDLPIFEFVQHPIVFNPNSKLVEHADNNNWRVVIERKDVIFDLKEFGLLKAT